MADAVAVSILPAGNAGKQEQRHLVDGVGLQPRRAGGLSLGQQLRYVWRRQQGGVRLRQALEHQLPGFPLQRILTPAARL